MEYQKSSDPYVMINESELGIFQLLQTVEMDVLFFCFYVMIYTVNHYLLLVSLTITTLWVRQRLSFLANNITDTL